MSFVKNLAKGGLFGLTGLALTGKDKKDKPKPSGTLMTEGFSKEVRPPSLLNQKHIY